jgi:hypothetical protein
MSAENYHFRYYIWTPHPSRPCQVNLQTKTGQAAVPRQGFCHGYFVFRVVPAPYRRLPSLAADQFHPLLIDIHTLDFPAGICPGAPSEMVALGFMIPPAPIFIRRRGQFSVQDSFDLLKTKRNLPLAFRQAAQIILKWSVFASHSNPFLRLQLLQRIDLALQAVDAKRACVCAYPLGVISTFLTCSCLFLIKFTPCPNSANGKRCEIKGLTLMRLFLSRSRACRLFRTEV